MNLLLPLTLRNYLGQDSSFDDAPPPDQKSEAKLIFKSIPFSRDGLGQSLCLNGKAQGGDFIVCWK